MRSNGRAPDQMRDIDITAGVARHAEGSCRVMFGDTHVFVTASIEERVPPWLRGKGRGWVTAEYGMLPRSTHSRSSREAVRGRQSGRTQEIQRLIGRSLRAAIDLDRLGERLITIDCDVLQADGGTRTAAISGGWVALRQALNHLLKQELIAQDPMTQQVAAVSCGLCAGTACLDLDYDEDSTAEVDANFVMTASEALVEAQASAEGALFDEESLLRMMRLARLGCQDIFAAQLRAVEA